MQTLPYHLQNWFTYSFSSPFPARRQVSTPSSSSSCSSSADSSTAARHISGLGSGPVLGCRTVTQVDSCICHHHHHYHHHHNHHHRRQYHRHMCSIHRRHQMTWRHRHQLSEHLRRHMTYWQRHVTSCWRHLSTSIWRFLQSKINWLHNSKCHLGIDSHKQTGSDGRVVDTMGWGRGELIHPKETVFEDHEDPLLEIGWMMRRDQGWILFRLIAKWPSVGSLKLTSVSFSPPYSTASGERRSIHFTQSVR